MERTLLETIHSLGLDVQLGVILLMFAIDGVTNEGRRFAAWATRQPRRFLRRTGTGRPTDAPAGAAWSPRKISEGGTAA